VRGSPVTAARASRPEVAKAAPNDATERPPDRRRQPAPNENLGVALSRRRAVVSAADPTFASAGLSDSADGPLPPGRDEAEADVMGARYGSGPAARRPTDFAKIAYTGRVSDDDGACFRPTATSYSDRLDADVYGAFGMGRNKAAVRPSTWSLCMPIWSGCPRRTQPLVSQGCRFGAPAACRRRSLFPPARDSAKICRRRSPTS
jgi:hypothetical protein